MTAYVNDKGTRWGIDISGYDLPHQKVWWMLYRKLCGQGWHVVGTKRYESETDAQAALDDMAKRKGWKRQGGGE